MKYKKIHPKLALRNAKNTAFLFKKIIATSREKTTEGLLKKLHKLKSNILARKDEPIVKNTIHYILHNIKNYSIIKTKEELLKRACYATERLNESERQIAEIGSTKIRKGMVVMIHGFSPAVADILIESKKRGINFEVHILESRPSFDGRKAAVILAKNRIPVKYYADAALRQALKRADVMLIGADALSEHGQIFSEIGSELIAEMAQKYDVPVYAIADSWNFDKESAKEISLLTDLQSSKELWSNCPKNIIVLNYGFEKIHPSLITGIITEKGIYKPNHLIFEIKQNYPWMFR